MIVQWLIQLRIILRENALEEEEENGKAEKSCQEICGGLRKPYARFSQQRRQYPNRRNKEEKLSGKIQEDAHHGASYSLEEITDDDLRADEREANAHDADTPSGDLNKPA